MTVPVPSVRYFTVAEANRTLPLVRMVVGDLVELYNDLHRRRERLVALRNRQGRSARGLDDPYEEEILQMETELETDAERLQKYVEELQQIGAELKDPFTGLTAFRSILDGREVYLCWMPGEEEITTWHELDAGYSGRQSLYEGVLTPEAFSTGSEEFEDEGESH